MPLSMKTFRCAFAGILFLTLTCGRYGEIIASPQQDSLAYYTIQGKIMDERTRNPIIFANVYLAGTNIGTVSNSDGEFLLKIPLFTENKTIVISSIGYKNYEISFERFEPEPSRIEIELAPSPIPIEAVTIINRDARELVNAALRTIPETVTRRPTRIWGEWTG
jgi:hypothetical protein